MADLIERLRECCTDSQGREMKDFAEPWGCEVALLREAATELEALRKRCEAVEARLESVRQDVLEFYDAIPSLPITPETMDAATDVLTKFCIDFQPIMEAAAQEPSHG